MTSPTLQELIERVEADGALADQAMKAEALVSYIPESLHRQALLVLAERLLCLRQQRGSRVGGDVSSPLDKPVPAPRQYGPEVTTAAARDKRATGTGHASPKIALATKAWVDLLATAVVLPGADAKVEIRDMSGDQLHVLADSLFDTHERLHRLAEHLTLNGARCARELEPAALEACMSEAA
jgi:hypothetical protein